MIPKDFILPEELEIEDLEDESVYNMYASLETNVPNENALITDFYSRARELGADVDWVMDKLRKLQKEAYEYYRDQYLESHTPLACLADIAGFKPVLAEPIISGILRSGHKMLINGDSKAGKSFLALELAVAIATGTKWMGEFQCEKMPVAFYNMEIDNASFEARIKTILTRLGLSDNIPNFYYKTLRGETKPLDKLAKTIIEDVQYRFGTMPGAVFIDPIYKVMTGDENSATDMGFFTSLFDKIAKQTKSAVIFVHHHAKGVQGGKKAIDRGSGSGVFARDPDAIVDMSALAISEDDNIEIPDGYDEHSLPFQMSFNLREFPPKEPISLWFTYPVHKVDRTGLLDALFIEGSPQANLALTPNHQQAKKKSRLAEAYEQTKGINGASSVKAIAEYLEVSDRTVRNWIDDSGEFSNSRGVVFPTSK